MSTKHNSVDNPACLNRRTFYIIKRHFSIAKLWDTSAHIHIDNIQKGKSDLATSGQMCGIGKVLKYKGNIKNGKKYQVS